jgi:hypothetical protein
MMFNDGLEVKHITDRASYNAVAKAHKSLSKTERNMVIKQLTNAYNQYEIEIVQIASFRRQLYRVYDQKVRANQSVAVLSRDFNMSLKGHNAEIAQQLGAVIAAAYTLEAESYRSQAVKLLLSTRLSMIFLTSEEVIKLLRENGSNDHAQTALSLLKQIVQYQETLFRSVIWLATKVAKQATWQGEGNGSAQWKRLSGDVIQEADMIQEAIIAAKYAVQSYKPGLHGGLSFTSFVYNYVSGMLSKYVNENTRVVSIPRTIMDRYLPLQAVIDANPILTQYGQYYYEAIAHAVSEAKEGTPYSAVEVEWLLLNVSRETASLDLEVPVSKDGSSDPVTLGESLINQGLSQDIAVDRAHLKENILKVIRDYTDMVEYTVLKLRWGGSKLLSLEQTAKAYTNLTELDMNKGKVAKIESDVFQRLRRANDPRFAELLSVIDDNSEGVTTMLDLQENSIRCGGRKL